MILRSVERAPGSFQQPLTEDQITAMARRAFGEGTDVVSAIELGDGSYNSTYRVALASDFEIILRVAPEPARQLRAERAFMRNEHAAAPYFAPIAALLPRTLCVDFTHDLIGRDYMFQTIVPGIPAREGLEKYPRERWTPFYRDLGAITKQIHAVRGDSFGPMIGPRFPTWSGAVRAALADIVADLDDAGLDTAGARELADMSAANEAILDEVREPRLLHGDLWTINVMIEPDAPEPTVCGLFDCDRVSWGDPESDWAIYRAAGRPGTERDAFWQSYGPLDASPPAQWRRLLYEARNIAAARLEYHRLGRDLTNHYDELDHTLARLRSLSVR
jgi:aminoglycoside phosphotransferase (APT) family kinase protein